ncbi:pilus assembly protein [Sphingomonas naphthae]|uniref:Pilus assembly protein n=1 Tax=Sphingomonas naphthae TaxID=1813468 RepID=A0ABY7TMY1_9SPHN|nr:TadE/TadG family type IV pilus assembly protein [Sphingomonas naphthae]WCT74598.1 pilus assembly protein [Sphingomonas naphthae]
MRRLLSSERGTATIEFALVSLFFFGLVVVALDFGAYVQQKLRLGAAVEQGSIMAFNTRDSVVPANVSNYISAAARTATAPTTAITCNQGQACTNTGRTCACYNAASKAFTAAASCSATCTDGALAGYYMTITSTTPYQAMIVPDALLSGRNLVQTAVVRLQ